MKLAIFCRLFFVWVAQAQQDSKPANPPVPQYECAPYGEVNVLVQGYTPTKAAIADCQKQYQDRPKQLNWIHCASRYIYREDGTDDPACKGIPPDTEMIKAAQQFCNKGSTASYCGKLLPLPKPMPTKAAAKKQ